MAEEEKKDEVQSQADAGSSAEETKAGSTEKEETNWEQKFNDAQAQITQSSQKAAELQEQIDTITPYVDFGRAQGAADKSTEESGGEDRYISEKEAQKMLTDVRNEFGGKLIAIKFRSENPELVEYEKSIVTPAVVRLSQQHPTWNHDKLLKEAVTFTQGLLEKERDKGGAEVTAKTEEKQKAAGAASGLGSAGVTSPKKEEKPGETTEEYMARRKEQSRKARGVI